jgi:transposase InsO family protein
MSTPIEDIYEYLKANNYKKQYLDKFTLDTDPINPLLNVVPTTDQPDFFGTKVCNILVFNKPFVGWDFTSVSAVMAWFTGVYDQFARYKTCIFIDNQASAIQSASSSVLDAMESDINTFLGDYAGSSYGFSYEGKLDQSALQARIIEILDEFYAN